MLTSNQLLQKGRYRIINSLANDHNVGFYAAYDTVSNANVVLRESVSNANVVLRESVGNGGQGATPAQIESVNAAFMGDAKTLSGVKHDALLSVRDYFSEVDRQYLVMESVEGQDLASFLDTNEKRPAVSDVLKWADQLLDGLSFLHSLPKPFVHRDVRPDNIRLTKNYSVKLLTAGLESWVGSGVNATKNYSGDDVMLHYRPLEQLWNGLDPTSQKVIANSFSDESSRIITQPLDARCDLYSLAATMYHILSRTLPSDALERAIEILEGNPDPLQPLSEVESSVPAEVSAAIMKALSIKREDRFASATEMRNELLRSQGRSPAKAAPASKQAAPPAEENLLLEVEHVASAKGAKAADFEWSDEELYKEEPAAKAPAKAGSYDTDFSLDVEPAKKSWMIPAIVAVVVLAAAIGGYLMMSGGSKAPAASPTASEPAASAPSIPSQTAQQPSQTLSSEPANSTVSSPESETPSAESTSKPSTERRAEAAPAKAAKPTPAAAKPTEQKKKVTVDDLINDN
jgi:serine/threonine protein kinase